MFSVNLPSTDHQCKWGQFTLKASRNFNSKLVFSRGSMKWEKVFFLLLLEKVEEISGHPVEGGRKGGMERLMDGWMDDWMEGFHGRAQPFSSHFFTGRPNFCTVLAWAWIWDKWPYRILNPFTFLPKNTENERSDKSIWMKQTVHRLFTTPSA